MEQGFEHEGSPGRSHERSAGGWAWGFAAAAVFVLAAVMATVVAYVYGNLFGIAPEFPMILSLPFLVSFLLMMLVAPLAGALTAQALREQTGSITGPVIAAIVGAAVMILTWEITSGPGANPLDWPHSLHFLQLAASGTAAGFILGAGIAGPTGFVGARGFKVSAAGVTVLLIVLTVPFLPLWQAKRDFQAGAADTAARYIQLPAGLSLAVEDESSGRDALQANVRYKAVAAREDDGKAFALDVIGERRGYDIDIKDIHGYIRISDEALPMPMDWNDPLAYTRTERAALELARSYSKAPLEIVSVRRDLSGVSIVIRGDGLEMIARPGGADGGQGGVHYSFTAVPGR